MSGDLTSTYFVGRETRASVKIVKLVKITRVPAVAIKSLNLREARPTTTLMLFMRVVFELIIALQPLEGHFQRHFSHIH